MKAATLSGPISSIVRSSSAMQKSAGSSPPKSSLRYGHGGVRCLTWGSIGPKPSWYTGKPVAVPEP